nr:DUF3387 domain-containing protein [Halochromatium roseum]
MGQSIEWILSQQQAAAARECDETAKQRAHRRYQDAVLQLSKAYALASASEEAKAIRDEVGFFQAIRAALVKSSSGGGHGSAERDAAIAQLIDRSVVSTEIVDIRGAAGIRSPDISILSDEFLAEIAQTPQKHLALEALRKLLNDQVRLRSCSNVSESRRFSERLEAAIARYHSNAISTVEVLQELIEIAKELRAAQARGEEAGLSEDELAFYDALAENQSAVEVMGNAQLKVIAHELLVQLQGNITVDWAHRENARAKMRVLVKRILRKYGYPPDLQAAAVQTVLAQAWRFGREALLTHLQLAELDAHLQPRARLLIPRFRRTSSHPTRRLRPTKASTNQCWPFGRAVARRAFLSRAAATRLLKSWRWPRL